MLFYSFNLENTGSQQFLKHELAFPSSQNAIIKRQLNKNYYCIKCPFILMKSLYS